MLLKCWIEISLNQLISYENSILNHLNFKINLEMSKNKTLSIRNTSSKKRKYNKIKFSPEDEETLIDMVKENAELYNPRHEKYKDKHHKDRIWLDIAKQMNKPSETKH